MNGKTDSPCRISTSHTVDGLWRPARAHGIGAVILVDRLAPFAYWLRASTSGTRMADMRQVKNGRPFVFGETASQRIKISLTTDQVAELDRLRGDEPRACYARRVLLKAMRS